MNNRKPIFFTSDTHYGHENSIKFDTRPFTDIRHMERVLVNNYNAAVPAHGLCYFLGDVGLASVEYTRSVIEQLNGTKVLVLGNHDKAHNSMYNMGFDVVVNGLTLWIAGREVTMTHCPLRGVWRENVYEMKNSDGTENWHGENKHIRFSVPDRGQFHLHGHVHTGPHNDKKRIDNKQFDVGVCANNYRPVSISEIESWIAKYGR